MQVIIGAIKEVLNDTWPMILLSIIVLTSIRIAYLYRRKEKIIISNEIMLLTFIVYILCLFQVVTFQDDTSWASNNFIPFREIFRYNITSRLFIKNVLGNMIMFLPFGFFASYYLRAEKLTLPLILTLVASLSIEVVQMAIGRVFDVDDIILNLLGGTVGFYIYVIFYKAIEKLPKFCHSEWFLDILAVILSAGLITTIIMII